MLDGLEIVHLTWIVGHFARWAITDDRVVVLSLYRVSVSLWHPMSLSLINLCSGLMYGCVVVNVPFLNPVLCVLHDPSVHTLIPRFVCHRKSSHGKDTLAMCHGAVIGQIIWSEII